MRKILRSSFTLAILAAVVSQAAAAGIEIKPKFNAGDKVYIETTETAKQTVSGAMLPEPMVVESGEVVGFIQETGDTTDKGTQLTLTFDRRGMHLNHPMMRDVEYDSDDGAESDDDNSASMICVPFIGKTLTMTLKGTNVTAIEGFDALLEAIEDSAMGDMLYEQLREQFTESAMKVGLVESRYHVFPQGEVSVGDTWTNSFEIDIPMLGDTINEYKCKLAKLDGDGDAQLAHIEFKATTVSAPGSEPPANAMGMKPELKSMSHEGTAVINVARGMVVSSNTHTIGLIEMSMPSTGEETVTMKVEIDSESVTRVLTVKERAAEKAEHLKQAKEAAAAKAEAAAKEAAAKEAAAAEAAAKAKDDAKAADPG